MIAERRWIRPVDLTKPIGPKKVGYDDIRLDVFTCFPAANCLHSAGNDSNCESAKKNFLCKDKFCWINYGLIWRSEMSILK